MSQWDPEKASSDPQGGLARGPLVPFWIRTLPFFMSAVLFLSGIFTIFSPLPLIFFSFRSNRVWVFFAAITNTFLVAYLGGSLNLAFYLVFVLTLALSLPIFLKPHRSLERSAGLCLLVMFAVGVLIVGAIWLATHANPWLQAREHLSKFFDALLAGVSSEVRTNWLGGADIEEWKNGVFAEIPSFVGIFALVLIWSNMLILLRANPGGLRERLGIEHGFFKEWKSPSFFLWPTILAGFFLVFDFGWLTGVAYNVFKILMVVYALHGLSILSFVFDAWNVRGLFRTGGFIVAVLLMMPLVLALGFFDLWFDFRGKLRQS